MNDGLAGKVALVTGAASGIGRASALAFAREGAKVVIADVDGQGGMGTALLIEKAGGQALFVRADVSKSIEVEAMVRRAVEAYGRLDCAHNNAGIDGVRAFTADCTEENWERILAIDLKGVWLCMKYEIVQMVKQGRGAIVNTSSVAGLAGAPGRAAYSASKHGVLGLTRTAALEYAKDGIRVNAVCPGQIRTPMMERFIGGDPEREAMVTAREPVGRLGSPEEVAEAVLWLCSDAASFVTGHALAVDGGMMAR